MYLFFNINFLVKKIFMEIKNVSRPIVRKIHNDNN
jgi:hypothetical protein